MAMISRNDKTQELRLNSLEKKLDLLAEKVSKISKEIYRSCKDEDNEKREVQYLSDLLSETLGDNSLSSPSTEEREECSGVKKSSEVPIVTKNPNPEDLWDVDDPPFDENDFSNPSTVFVPACDHVLQRKPKSGELENSRVRVLELVHALKTYLDCMESRMNCRLLNGKWFKPDTLMNPENESNTSKKMENLFNRWESKHGSFSKIEVARPFLTCREGLEHIDLMVKDLSSTIEGMWKVVSQKDPSPDPETVVEARNLPEHF